MFFEVVGIAIFEDAANLHVGKSEGFRQISEALRLLNRFLKDLAIEFER
jgi:hypothetical protein